jgi:arginine decarboxylase
MERLAFERRVRNLMQDLPPLPDFSGFHPAFRSDEATVAGDIRSAFYLSYDEENCDYLDLHDGIDAAMDAGRTLVAASFIIPYPPGFPILVPGQTISRDILDFMRALDVNEIHGYRPDLGLRVFADAALEQLAAG